MAHNGKLSDSCQSCSSGSRRPCRIASTTILSPKRMIPTPSTASLTSMCALSVQLPGTLLLGFKQPGADPHIAGLAGVMVLIVASLATAYALASILGGLIQEKASAGAVLAGRD
jgi:hypothetical protein